MGTVEKSRSIGYHIDGYNSDKSVPVATGRTREEALGIACRRVLGSCVLDGSIAVQDRTTDVDEPTFVELTQFLNLHFIDLDSDNRRAVSGG